MKRTLTLVAAAALVVTAGCVGFITGDSAFSASAEPAVVPEADLAGTGYESGDVRPQRLNRTVSVAGQERQVNLTLWVSMYTKAPANASSVADASENASSVVLVSLPGVEIAGQSLNPLDIVSTEALFELVDRGVGETEREQIGTKSYTMFGENATADVFRIENGANGPAIVEMASVQHEGDIVVALATYSEGAGDDANVETLLGSAEHPAERP